MNNTQPLLTDRSEGAVANLPLPASPDLLAAAMLERGDERALPPAEHNPDCAVCDGKGSYAWGRKTFDCNCTPDRSATFCDWCGEEEGRVATHFDQPNEYGWRGDYCDGCQSATQEAVKDKAQKAAIDARHARLHVETALGMALRVDTHRCVRFSDITGWRLGGDVEPALYIERTSGRCVELNRSHPLFLDLCAELGLDVETWEGSL